ncbi:hypothetical protein [Lentzea sp.]|uniref:hypothetical protein n=1 Tax=Lentzea sp. TaxID=56099 RepID=UPI002BE1ADF8|nr:hypothetical protein [Lentzea sp.]HUQ60140.1 hypothetical protein [Lentzea sp.]
MWFNNKTTAALGCAVVVAAALATPAAAAVEQAACPTPEHKSVVVELAGPGRWSYTYHVTWCVEAGKITGITPHLTNTTDGSVCTSFTSAEEAEWPLGNGSEAWRAFNMGEFSCKKGDGTDGSVNPWGTIEVLPDGRSRIVEKGIGDVRVE